MLRATVVRGWWTIFAYFVLIIPDLARLYPCFRSIFNFSLRSEMAASQSPTTTCSDPSIRAEPMRPTGTTRSPHVSS